MNQEAENLKKERNRNPLSEKILEFGHVYTRNSKSLCCFFEGEDAKYYGIRIKNLIPNLNNSNYATIECKGKHNLLELHKKITNQSQYKFAWIAFFVDKDFDSEDELPKSQDLYCTPYYSIENFYVSLSAFEEILREEFKIYNNSKESEEEFNGLCELFKENLEKFHDAIEEFNMWLLLQRQKKKEGQEQQLNLNDISLTDELVSINIGNITKKYTLSNLNNLFPNAVPVEQLNELQDQLNWIKGKRDERWKIFRGKYEIEFFRRFLEQLKEDAGSKEAKRKYFKQKRTVNFTLSNKNIISALCQYADTPNCLRHFLEQLKDKGIKSNTNS